MDFYEREGLFMKVDWSHDAVVRRWMVFCEVVAVVVFALAPIYFELVLAYAVSEPVEAHVNGF